MCMHDFETKDMRNMVRKVRITGGEVCCVDRWRIVEEFGCWMERWSSRFGCTRGWCKSTTDMSCLVPPCWLLSSLCPPPFLFQKSIFYQNKNSGIFARIECLQMGSVFGAIYD